MKKLLLIVYLLFLSCDSSELFGVHELDDTTHDYYDHVARGWQAIFDEDENTSHCPSPVGRLSSLNTSKVCQILAAEK